jgi:hypothetical protein
MENIEMFKVEYRLIWGPRKTAKYKGSPFWLLNLL